MPIGARAMLEKGTSKLPGVLSLVNYCCGVGFKHSSIVIWLFGTTANKNALSRRFLNPVSFQTAQASGG